MKEPAKIHGYIDKLNGGCDAIQQIILSKYFFSVYGAYVSEEFTSINSMFNCSMATLMIIASG